MSDAPAGNWSPHENEIIVHEYLGMLAEELQGVSVVKKQVNKRVQQATGRGRGAIEYKFQNVSAVLNHLRHPFVLGCKPASNYQEALVDAVLAALESRPDVERSAVRAMTELDEVAARGVELQLAEAPPFTKRPVSPRTPRRATKRNYVELEQRNSALGRAGELVASHWEQQRLKRLGWTNSPKLLSTSATLAATVSATTSAPSRKTVDNASSRSRPRARARSGQ